MWVRQVNDWPVMFSRPHKRGQRAVAQLGSALDWGSRGRRFKSCQPDSSSLLDRGSSQSESTDLTPYLTPYTARGRRLCHSSSRTRHAIVRSSSGLSQRGFTGGGEHPSCLTYSRGPRTPTRPRSTGGGLLCHYTARGRMRQLEAICRTGRLPAPRSGLLRVGVRSVTTQLGVGDCAIHPRGRG